MTEKNAGTKEQSVEVRLALEEGRAPVRATVQARTLSSSERTLRALKWLVLLWALAAAFIPVPIVHFIMVPSLLLAGPFFAWRNGSKTAVIESGTLSCARCSKPVVIEEKAYGWPAEVFCKACGVSLSLAPPAVGLSQQ